MFYILNLQLFLWIYGTLNKMNEWIKLKNYICNKKVIYFFLITMCNIRVMNSASLYGILTEKNNSTLTSSSFVSYFRQLVSPL